MRIFDTRGRGVISLSDFQEIAQDLLAPCSNPYLLNSQTYQIFKRFDKDCDGYLNLNEFSDFILPIIDERAADDIANRSDQRVSQDAVELLKRLIKTQITVNGSHEFLRGRLRKSLEKQYLTLNDAFKSIDMLDRGFLNMFDIQDMLSEFKQGGHPSEIAQIADLLVTLYDRQSTNGSSARGISHWQFIEMLTP